MSQFNPWQEMAKDAELDALLRDCISAQLGFESWAHQVTNIAEKPFNEKWKEAVKIISEQLKTTLQLRLDEMQEKQKNLEGKVSFFPL